jgi:hypothetical protein
MSALAFDEQVHALRVAIPTHIKQAIHDLFFFMQQDIHVRVFVSSLSFIHVSLQPRDILVLASELIRLCFVDYSAHHHLLCEVRGE